ncbi:PD40 domain-containing protein [bacterium]|nr:PD40 domain-containing protein [bacterium]
MSRKSTAFLMIPVFLAILAGPLAAQEKVDAQARLKELAKKAKEQGDQAAEAEASQELPEGLRQLTHNGKGKRESQPEWDADLSGIYFVEKGGGVGRIMRLDLKSAAVDTIVAHDFFNASQPAVSPDGKFLAYQTRRVDTHESIWIRRLEDGLEGKLSEDVEVLETGPAWNAQGGKLYFNRKTPNSQNHRAVSCLKNGDAMKVVGREQGSYYAPTLSMDGEQVAWLHRHGRDTKIVLMNTELTALTRDVRTPGYTVAAMDWLPDGESMIVSYMDNSNPDHGFDIGLLNLENGSIELLVDLGHYDSDPCISPDGTHAVFVANPQGQQDLYLLALPSEPNMED